MSGGLVSEAGDLWDFAERIEEAIHAKVIENINPNDKPTIWKYDFLTPEDTICRTVDFHSGFITNDYSKVTCQSCLEWLHA